MIINRYLYNYKCEIIFFSAYSIISIIHHCILLLFNELTKFWCVECEHLVWTSGRLGEEIMYIRCGEEEHPTLMLLPNMFNKHDLYVFRISIFEYVNIWISTILNTWVLGFLYMCILRYLCMCILKCLNTYKYYKVYVYV